MSTVIKVENLSKQYRLGNVGTGTLSHDLKRWWYKARGKEDPYLLIGETNDRTRKADSDYVWALKDINFEVKAGEVLGIIGRNGAGKSTLLKILSKTTAPTTGSIKVKGRIASLLEVGTGFHPELTGRENIYLNGAILGMTRREIQSKFDEIVDFSGVERYIDTPVKRFSSGMYVRLAFAVAAHLEPEILIVDEVLAVGDAEFQKKCLGKMKDVSVNDGRTVLFVSHQLGSIAQLCNRAILMNNGALSFADSTKKVIDFYLKSSQQIEGKYFFSDDPKKFDYYIEEMGTVDASGLHKAKYGTDEKIFLKVKLKITKNNPIVELAIALMDKNSYRVFTIHEKLLGNILQENDKEKSLIFEFPAGFLASGCFTWVATIHIPHQTAFHLIENVAPFTVFDTGTNLADYEGTDIGVVFAPYELKVVY